MPRRPSSISLKSDVTEAPSSSAASENASEIASSIQLPPKNDEISTTRTTTTAKSLPSNPKVTAATQENEQQHLQVHKQPLPLSSASTSKESKPKNQKQKDGSLKSMIEDETNTSESTATEGRRKTPATAKTQTAAASPAANHKFHSPNPATPYRNPQGRTPICRTPIYNESAISPTTREVEPSRKHRSRSTMNEPFLNKVNKNISQIELDQQKQIAWIRRLRKQKWISFLDVSLTGFTLLFYSIAFYLICHINLTLESKLIPEFHVKSHSMMNRNSFFNCNHSSWISTKNYSMAVVDDSRCFNRYFFGRVIYETYKSLSPDSATNGCNIDRVEIHPCYEKEGPNDPWHILWGPNYTNSDASKAKYYCNGSIPDGKDINFWSFNPPVMKHPLYNMDQSTPTTIASSAQFFLQCPKCNLLSRTEPPYTFYQPGQWYYYMNETVPSIPNGFRTCSPIFSFSCNFNENIVIKNCEKTFSQQVLPFTFVQDLQECQK